MHFANNLHIHKECIYYFYYNYIAIMKIYIYKLYMNNHTRFSYVCCVRITYKLKK